MQFRYFGLQIRQNLEFSSIIPYNNSTIGLYAAKAEDMFILSLPVQLHTMEPSSDANLKMFESELEKYQEFFLCPAYMPDRAAEPSV